MSVPWIRCYGVRSPLSSTYVLIPGNPMRLAVSILSIAVTTALLPAAWALLPIPATGSLTPGLAQAPSRNMQEALSQQQNQFPALELEAVSQLQSLLQGLEQPAVVFYPLILDDRLELVLITPDSPPHRYTVPVTRAELNQTVTKFWQALRDSRSNPESTAQQLYQWLIAPIEDDLRSVNAEAILYVPDGILRYVPLAALHTGEQWLTEQYLINHLTATSLADFTRRPQQPPRVLAAAHSEGSFEVAIGDRSLHVSGFPSAKAEVEAIAELMSNTTVLLDEAFSLDAVLPQINDHTVVHLAANVWVFPDSLEESFVLFGNGDRLSLSEIRNGSMPNVDLVVISACETAVDHELGNGQEIVKLSDLMQNAGAGAVITPLWQVDDFGTKELMVSFYQSLSQGSSYAEALRQAQIALIATESMPQTRQQKAEIEIRPGVPRENARSGLSHPYYWAPFILIGNGL